MYRVYEYGQSGHAHIEERAALEQISKRHRLWNRLVEIEHGYRSSVREALRDERQDKIDALKARKTALVAEIRQRRQTERKRSVDLGTLPAELKEARQEFRTLVDAAKADRPARIAARKATLEKLEAERRLAVKAATHEAQLYWCNTDDALLCYDVARSRAMKTGVDLRFHSWRGGEGKVAVRYQTGLPVAEAFTGKDRRLQIDPVPTGAYELSRAERKKLTRTYCRIRVGSNERREPIWLEVPIALHRPLPENGVIRTVFAVREVIRTRVRWKIEVCVDEGDQPAAVRMGPRVAVDLGWRMVDEGLRVAYWADEKEEHGQLVLPPEVLWEFQKLDDLRQIQDKHLEQVKEILARRVAEQETLPTWMTTGEPGPSGIPRPPRWENIGTIAQWRSPARMERLARGIPDHASDDLKRPLRHWLERHMHLNTWEKHLRDQLLRRRREIYRTWARNLASTHGVVVLERFDLRRVAEVGDTEAKRTKPQGGGQRTIAAPSVLRTILKALGQWQEVEAKYTTQQCSWCLFEGKWDAAKSVKHRCERCGELFDQDHNAARNMLRVSQIEPVSEQKPDLPDLGLDQVEKETDSISGTEAVAVASSGPR